jgi:hypothetical protein
MQRIPTRPLLLAVLAVLLVGVALVATGCGSSAPVAKKKLTPIPVTTPTADAAAVSAADAAAAAAAAPVSSGPITTLTSSSAVTTKLAIAARAYLKTTSKFTINQLFQQGNVAIGDITPKSGGARIFIAWVGPTWQVVWTAPMGQGSSTLVRAAVPSVSTALAAKMNWNPKVAAGSSGSISTSGGSADLASLKTSFIAYAKAAMVNVMGGADPNVTLDIQDVRVVPDNSGVYWASGLAQPSAGDSVTFYAKYSGGKWVSEGDSNSVDDPAVDSRFPEEVRPYL